jgi:hypothetical protein
MDYSGITKKNPQRRIPKEESQGNPKKIPHGHYVVRFPFI